MKTFIVSHDGIWLPGYSVVTAQDEKEAKSLVRQNLKDNNLNHKYVKIEKEVNCSIANTELIYNGNY